MTHTQLHLPVMCDEVISCLTTPGARSNSVFLDATFGRGEHTRTLLNAVPGCHVFALDRDPDAIAFGKTILQPLYEGRLTFIEGAFSELDTVLRQISSTPPTFSGILFDLGVSSPQLDTPERGFSFMHDGPLDMRMSKAGISAADIVNHEDEETLANIFFHYGEERKSRRIAKWLVAERKARGPFTTTTQLAEAVSRAAGPRRKIHPATRVFQALRIAVNRELDELSAALPIAARWIEPGGCLAVLSFHSLEDRIVKNFFRSAKPTKNRNDQKTHILFSGPKKPVLPSREEIRSNPRARSAKLRWGMRLEDLEGGTCP